MTARVLIAGCGYLGAEVGRRLAAEGHTAFGVRRTAAGLPGGVRKVAVDLLHGDLAALPRELDAVVWALSPAPTEPGYRAVYVDGPQRLLRFLAARGDPVQRAVLVASTRIWHRDDGGWVDESTPPDPIDFRGAAVLAGEQVFAGGPFRAVSLRFAGLYGPGRTSLLDRIAAGEAAPPRDAVFGNRIFRDDGAAAVCHALFHPDPAPAYTVADDDPADLRDVYGWLAERLGTTLPAPVWPFPGRGGSKRCRNRLLHDSGLRLGCPDYRAGYARLLPRA